MGGGKMKTPVGKIDAIEINIIDIDGAMGGLEILLFKNGCIVHRVTVSTREPQSFATAIANTTGHEIVSSQDLGDGKHLYSLREKTTPATL